MKDAKGHGSNAGGGRQLPVVESFSNTSAAYRRSEDIKDELAGIEDNGERVKGEKAALTRELNDLTAAQVLASGPKSAPVPTHDSMNPGMQRRARGT
jgi:hypothetical protein